jgi:hypothetical protein
MKKRISRVESTRKPSRVASNDEDSSWLKTGKDIDRELEKVQAESEHKAELRKRTGGIDPSKARFWLKAGEDAEIVILDESPDTVALYEHNMKRDGKYGHFESCPGEWENCPLCKAGNAKAYVWFLTILDLRGYTKDDGTEVPYLRRLLPIKQTQQGLFKQIFKAAVKENGTLRGTVLVLSRDKDDKSPSIGTPAVLDNGKMYDFISEEALIEEFGHDPVKAKNGDVLFKRNGLLKPMPYPSLFTKPSAADIAERWGLEPQTGSDAEYSRVANKFDDEDEDDDIPFGKNKKSVRRAKASAKPDDDDEGEEDADEEDAKPSRKPSRSLRRGKAKPVADDDEDDDAF